jgi:O-acetyl-ADP-ribose deacetylase (regulator of RNase III)
MKSNIKFVEGDLFKSKCQTITNTVNCHGVMGKGIALEFKKRYPRYFNDYKFLCKNNLVKLGYPYIYTESTVNTPLSILSFPTKDHWTNNSNIQDIVNGLNQFCKTYKDYGVTSIAFPPLGCGCGGLNWGDVVPIMNEFLSKIDIPVEIYLPLNAIPKQLEF